MRKEHIRKNENSYNYPSILDIVTWHKKTFPDAGVEGQREKIKEEKREWLASGDIMELADIYIVSCGLTRYGTADAMMGFHYVEEQCLLKGIFHKDLIKAVDNKMKINYHRQWEPTKEGSYHHL